MSQEKFTSLAIIFIENEEGQKLEIETILDVFAKSNSQKNRG